MKPDGNSMLFDIQYVKSNRREGLPDFLYIIWRDLITQDKYLDVIPEPEMDIYFEKEEIRKTHSYSKNYEKIVNLIPVRTKYKDIPREIANDWLGVEQANKMFQEIYQNQEFGKIKNLFLYPYVYGADYDAVSFYRLKWLRELDNDIPKKLHKGFLDIEVDGLEVPGMPSPETCPINAVTFIDEWNKTVYTFCLVKREFIPRRDTDNVKRKAMYDHMYEEQEYLMNHLNEFNDELHELFDESYGHLNYKQYFYTDERKMLVHLFQLINQLKLDFIGIWNIAFDIPYILNRLRALGLDPKDVICHKDFPNKVCYFREDKNNHDIKNKNDVFTCSSYTIYYDQMELYASIRKGASELRSYKLNNIAQIELKDSKLDYSEDGDIKTLPYTNFSRFLIYNIKDVLLQLGIERRTSDFDTLYISSYKNATPYDKVFKQTIKLRNVQYLSFYNQGLIPGENINIFNQETEEEKKRRLASEDEDDDEAFEGALVADPYFNDYVGIALYGDRRTNNIFLDAIDFDMAAFYPNTIQAMNIDPSTLHFKVFMPMAQFKQYGGKKPFHGITMDNFAAVDDGSKECFDNFQTQNYISFGHKWMNLPDVSKVYYHMVHELGAA